MLEHYLVLLCAIPFSKKRCLRHKSLEIILHEQILNGKQEFNHMGFHHSKDLSAQQISWDCLLSVRRLAQLGLVCLFFFPLSSTLNHKKSWKGSLIIPFIHRKFGKREENTNDLQHFIISRIRGWDRMKQGWKHFEAAKGLPCEPQPGRNFCSGYSYVCLASQAYRDWDRGWNPHLMYWHWTPAVWLRKSRSGSGGDGRGAVAPPLIPVVPKL